MQKTQLNILQQYAKSLTSQPGVYRFYDTEDQIIYVGKAKNLHNRVSSYFEKRDHSAKTQKLVSQIVKLDITITQTEKEALLLESNLIKKHRPKYNILLRDDKSYPFIFISDERFPRVMSYRGSRKQKGDYFGPYPSGYAVKQALDLLQKIFPVRTCSPSFFNNRTRPCLQYQIKRCTAPCVGLITPENYTKDIEAIKQFLRGNSETLHTKLLIEMELASERQQYEHAARLRDQIQALRSLQQQQIVSTNSSQATDVIAIAEGYGMAMIAVMLIRDGQIIGIKSYPIKPNLDESVQDILQAFCNQYYTVGLGAMNRPKVLVIDQTCLPDATLMDYFKTEFNTNLQWVNQPKTTRLKWLTMAQDNAKEALAMHLLQKQTAQQKWTALENRLKQYVQTIEPLSRIECFDISHTQGEATVASCVVFNAQGADKKRYRRFNMTGITPGDDYAAIHQAVKRRYQRLLQEDQSLPEVVFIDGGQGQLHAAQSALSEAFESARTELSSPKNEKPINTAKTRLPSPLAGEGLRVRGPLLIGIAKGPERKAGLEVLWFADQPQSVSLDPTDPALHLIQQIRDEAHRFAIMGNRMQRDKKRRGSPLEDIPGVGPKTRKALIRHFGGWQGVKSASFDDLCKVPGINKKVAERITETLSNS